jgi:hypothetical protein
MQLFFAFGAFYLAVMMFIEKKFIFGNIILINVEGFYRYFYAFLEFLLGVFFLYDYYKNKSKKKK